VKPKRFYLVLCILGAVLPYSQFAPWLGEHAVNGRLFVQQLFATRISAFFALDVIVSAAVVLRFIRAESGRLRISHAWLAIPATLLVGVSLSLPLFLYLRELQLERTGAEAPS
jgi:Protein of unknown function DUF2834